MGPSSYRGNMTRHHVKYTEDKLCGLLGRDYTVLTSRGSSALYALLKAFGRLEGYGRVVMPAVVCPSVPSAVLYSGHKPIFCDVSLQNYNIDVKAMEDLLSRTEDIRGIIAVHLFGYPSEIEKLIKISDEYGIFLIEDAAQALGGKHGNKMLGSFGDASILSFGHTKIIDKADAGAITTNREDLLPLIDDELKNLPPQIEEINGKKELYSKVYYALQPFLTNHNLNELFIPLPYIFRDIYLYKKGNQEMEIEAEKIYHELDELTHYVSKRQENASSYRKYIQHSCIIHPDYKDSEGVPWRYSVLIKKYSREITEMIRERGIDVSNWYPPLHRWFLPGRQQNPDIFTNSEYIGAHILNFWTEPKITGEMVRYTADTILEILEEMTRNEAL